MESVLTILLDAFDRVRQATHAAVDGLSAAELAYQADPQANSVGWLAWHLARVQDRQISQLSGREQRWFAGGWVERFGLPYDREAHGYGQSAEDVASFQVDSPELLTAYYDETHQATLDYLHTLTQAELERVVDRNWDPPVTVAVRLVSVLSDDLQHAGQAAFVRGLVTRR